MSLLWPLVIGSHFTALYAKTHVHNFCLVRLNDFVFSQYRAYRCVHCQCVRALTEKGGGGCLIHCETVDQQTSFAYTQQRGCCQMLPRSALNVVWVMGSQDAFGSVHICTKHWPILVGAVGADVDTKSQHGLRVKLKQHALYFKKSSV